VLFQSGRSTHVVAGRAPVKVDGTPVKRIPLAVPVRVHRYVTQHLSWRAVSTARFSASSQTISAPTRERRSRMASALQTEKPLTFTTASFSLSSGRTRIPAVGCLFPRLRHSLTPIYDQQEHTTAELRSTPDTFATRTPLVAIGRVRGRSVRLNVFPASSEKRVSPQNPLRIAKF